MSVPPQRVSAALQARFLKNETGFSEKKHAKR
jgi:hypothetical protein